MDEERSGPSWQVECCSAAADPRWMKLSSRDAQRRGDLYARATRGWGLFRRSAPGRQQGLQRNTQAIAGAAKQSPAVSPPNEEIATSLRFSR
jgi:hypothetical protein